jgi:aromatic ring hydroxylase-like protein
VPKTDGLAQLEGPAIGDRAPDADLGAGRVLFDFTRHPRFTLLALAVSGGSKTNVEAVLRPLQERFGAVLESHVVPPSSALAKYYGNSARDRLYLLRPDGYVGFRCLSSEASRLEAHLADLFTL